MNVIFVTTCRNKSLFFLLACFKTRPPLLRQTDTMTHIKFKLQTALQKEDISLLIFLLSCKSLKTTLCVESQR